MSMESAVAFYERLESDEKVMTRIQKLQTREAIGLYVREELGYDFSLEEMQKVVFERNPEITDEEMEAVIGGELGTAEMVLGGIAIGLGGVAIGMFGTLAGLAAAAA